MDEKILGFVMSGGVGSRLWPLSREDNPKQFHALSGADSMLVKTVKRVAARSKGPVSVNLIAAERHAERALFDLKAVVHTQRLKYVAQRRARADTFQSLNIT